MPDGLKIGALVLERSKLSPVRGVFTFVFLVEHSRVSKFKQMVLSVLLAELEFNPKIFVIRKPASLEFA